MGVRGIMCPAWAVLPARILDATILMQIELSYTHCYTLQLHKRFEVLMVSDKQYDPKLYHIICLCFCLVNLSGCYMAPPTYTFENIAKTPVAETLTQPLTILVQVSTGLVPLDAPLNSEIAVIQGLPPYVLSAYPNIDKSINQSTFSKGSPLMLASLLFLMSPKEWKDTGLASHLCVEVDSLMLEDIFGLTPDAHLRRDLFSIYLNQENLGHTDQIGTFPLALAGEGGQVITTPTMYCWQVDAHIGQNIIHIKLRDVADAPIYTWSFEIINIAAP